MNKNKKEIEKSFIESAKLIYITPFIVINLCIL